MVEVIRLSLIPLAAGVIAAFTEYYLAVLTVRGRNRGAGMLVGSSLAVVRYGP